MREAALLVPDALRDRSRHRSHANLRTPEGHPILSEHHEYLTIWGYWNGPDDVLAVKDQVVYEGIDALSAYREGRLSQELYLRVIHATQERLATAGMKDLGLCGRHLLLSIDQSQRLTTDQNGLPLVRIRNFEFMTRTDRDPTDIS